MKIGELAKATGCTVETIRFYEKQGLLPEVKRTSNNFRYYNTQHLTTLSFICYCRSLGLQISEIKTLLNLHNTTKNPSQEVTTLLDNHIKAIGERIHQLEHLRIELLKLKQELNNDQSNVIQNLLNQHLINFSRY
ncbi:MULTISPECIES: MerR family transcriptional regulator [Gallibacterium]|uniref:MerR family transcriptional regulator n=1 Tax=Gallibacterium genomosp. 3 TaxID=505345 RepID=A0A1A7NVD2_9PAST|nr:MULTISPECIES: MerR family transcriptional regulator [Gallibacterium]MDA3978784.1 MerR family transcriptional regulator [Gallibacterium sp. AGMB14963]OBW93653.1 MerR family transcriptional regulator [Gallibacterium genomosp. 3]